MAAYAALVSVMHIIEQIQNHHFPPVSLDQKQVDSLTEKVTFLQDFLEGYSHGAGDSKEANGLESRIADVAYAAEDVIESHIVDQIHAGSTSHGEESSSIHDFYQCLDKVLEDMDSFLEGYSHGAGDSKEADGLESRIADAAYAAEDVIESHIVDQIHAGSTSHGEKSSSIHDFYQCLDKVIEDMDSIKKEVMEVKEKTGVQAPPHRSSSIPAGSSRSPSTGQNRTMVGFDDVLYEILDKLTGVQPGRQIIPVVGMGGIGKTTLARNIYENQTVVQRFDILTWVTISQEYRMREILLELLQESGSEMNEDELGDKLHKSLFGMRYLIIMDDIWNIEVWDQLKFFFPDNNNGSRIILTTRLSELASRVADDSHSIKLGFLDDDKSWNLFCKTVFGKEDCPFEFERIGKEIVKNCKGLPLSIVVIGGLLAKSEQTRQHWEYIAENLNSIVNLEDKEHCLQILYRSYNSLPVHLKPCFLYMGIFKEDKRIGVSKLITLWVAEGFLKSIGGRSLEEAAEEYLKELIDRNLILVEQCNYYGKIKFCRIHDLLRDLCLREAQKQKFFCVLREQNLITPQEINTERRICFDQGRSKYLKEYPPQVLHALKSASLARSLIGKSKQLAAPLLSSFRLLRLFPKFSSFAYSIDEAICELVNLRYIAVRTYWNNPVSFPSSVSLLWNLQTLIVVSDRYSHFTSKRVIAPSEIWKMPQLRHVKFWSLQLPDPPSGCTDDIVLKNLQTLKKIRNFKCGEEVVKRIPNVKKLRIYYEEFDEEGSPNYCLHNLGHLHKLESLSCSFPYGKSPPRNMVQNLTFPHSLKKLCLERTHLHWEDMTTKIGSLPLLLVLKLKFHSFIGPHWETVEGQFCSLKILLIAVCDLEYWTTESTHFPHLEHLHLLELFELKEIPSSIGDIPTLQSIELGYCNGSAVDSAKRIQEEQEEFGNVGLQVKIWPRR